MKRYVKASYEPTGKPTLSGVGLCFRGVPKNQYRVVKDNGRILVITGRDMHTYWYAMEELFLRYNVLRYGMLSHVYEVQSVKTDVDQKHPYNLDVQEIPNDYDKYHMFTN